MMKKILIGLTILAFGVIGFVLYGKYNQIYQPNVPNVLPDKYLKIAKNTDYPHLKNQLFNQGYILDIESFDFVAKLMKFDQATIRDGRFKIQPNWSNRKLIQYLRSGKQSTVKFTITNERFIRDIAGVAGRQFEADSLTFFKVLTDEKILNEIGLDKENAISIFIPNTYELYWNTSPKDFLKRMIKENRIFWSKKNRLKKAKALGLNKKQVYTLASIVERETNNVLEMPNIAGVYLNRLRIDMPLQADPTVVFATGNLGLKRVLNKHLEFDSPYNTYLYKGLPPGPISMSSIAAIDAVLENKNHKYIYFCAKPDNSGTHAFAKTLRAHNVNAKKFANWLNKRGVK